jgi:heptosyltransferase-3
VDLEREAVRRGLPLRILVTRLRYLGDVIISTPVVSALKRRYPRAEIYFMAQAPYSSILEGHPDLFGIVTLYPSSLASLRAIARLRRIKFTAALDLFYNPRSAVMLYLAGIPVRVGGRRRWRRRLYTQTFSVPEGVRSAVSHHLYPLRIFDIDDGDELPRVYLNASERSAGADLVYSIVGEEDRDRPVIAIHPGGTWSSKRWPPRCFADLASGLKRRFNARVLIISGPGEEVIARAVMEETCKDVFTLPFQPVRSLAAVLDNCDAVVANDGGVLHMAVALGRPTVGIFGPTEPDVWFPYEGKGPFVLVTRNESCAPCHLHRCEDMRCLKAIGPEEVLAKVERVYEGEGNGGCGTARSLEDG